MKFTKLVVIIFTFYIQAAFAFAQGVRDICPTGENCGGDAGWFGWLFAAGWIGVMIWRWRETLAATIVSLVVGYLINPALGFAVWIIVWIYVSYRIEEAEKNSAVNAPKVD